MGAFLCIAIVNIVTDNAVFGACNVFASESQIRSIESRGIIWKQAITIFKNNPIIGIGGNNYPIIAEKSYSLNGGLYTASITNSYIQLLVENGIIGFLIFGGTVIAFIYKLFSKMESNSVISIVMFLFILTIAVKEFTFSTIFSCDYVFGIFIVSFALAINYVDLNECKSQDI